MTAFALPLLLSCASHAVADEGSTADAVTTCAPALASWSIDADTTVFRQPICTNFEAPFLYLLAGTERALLVDTGTGHVNVRGAVDDALAGRDLELVVAHSHSHGDHVGGDASFRGRDRTSIVGRAPADVHAFFELGPQDVAELDLGGRIIDVIRIPGHEAAHVAFYDRRTRVLLTGDTLYPGRLYVRDFEAYRASVKRLNDFARSHPVDRILGAHIELNAAGEEFEAGSTSHPDEHPLDLSVTELNELDATLEAMHGVPRHVARPHFVVFPL